MAELTSLTFWSLAAGAAAAEPSITAARVPVVAQAVTEIQFPVNFLAVAQKPSRRFALTLEIFLVSQLVRVALVPLMPVARGIHPPLLKLFPLAEGEVPATPEVTTEPPGAPVAVEKIPDSLMF